MPPKASPPKPLLQLFHSFAEFEAATPFDTLAAAKAYVAENPQYDYFGLRRDSVTRYGLRPAGTSVQMPVAPGSINGPQKTASLAVAKRAVTKGTPRYVELLGMLRNGPVTLDQVAARWGCTRAAASSLFSDVKNKCGATLAREGDTYSLTEGTC
jgi:hypothetical protein